MRLYTTTGATQVDDPEFGTFKPDADGAFDGLPDAMYAKLHGRPGWENDAERVARVAAEQMEKLRDPATMLAELQKMSAGQGALTALLANALGVGKAVEPSATPAPADTSDAGGDASTSVAKSATADEGAAASLAKPARSRKATTPSE